MSSQPVADKRLFSLDVLRGLAAALVLLRHAPGVESHGSANLMPLLEELFVGVARIGWIGVDLFFVLSGFLISGLLFKEFDRNEKLDVRRFWLRRGLKIWPSYYAAYGTMVLTWVACDAWTTGRVPLWHIPGLLPNVFFVQNYCAAEVRWPHSWSLAVEEHFYLFLPIVLALLVRCNKPPCAGCFSASRFRGLFWCGIVVSTSVLTCRAIGVGQGRAWGELYYPTHLRLDSLLFGVLLGYWNHYRRDELLRVARSWRTLVGAAAIAFVLPWIWPMESSHWMPSLGFTLIYMSFGSLVVLAAGYPSFGRYSPKRVAWLTRLLAGLGAYSYTVYLAHAAIEGMPGFSRLLTWSRTLLDSIWTERGLFWVLSVVGGILLSHLVERPVLAWRERRFPSRSRRVNPADPGG
jgi:peptidoglycan/LPS O-acetylase OafA/YrhL